MYKYKLITDDKEREVFFEEQDQGRKNGNESQEEEDLRVHERCLGEKNTGNKQQSNPERGTLA